jgi:hypothetical protein
MTPLTEDEIAVMRKAMLDASDRAYEAAPGEERDKLKAALTAGMAALAEALIDKAVDHLIADYLKGRIT